MESVWNYLRKRSYEIESGMDFLMKKRTGSYYTDLEMTDIMMEELVQSILDSNHDKKMCEYRFLEPCVGTGNFVFSYLKSVKGYVSGEDDVRELLNNIYVVDINPIALGEYKKLLNIVVKEFWGLTLTDKYFNEHIGVGLLFDLSADVVEYRSIHEVFPGEVVGRGFDIVVTNPPYKNLKAEMKHYDTIEDAGRDKNKYKVISDYVSTMFRYSVDGTLNLYKLFVEEILERYVSDGAFVSLLIPSTILSGKTSEKLRTYILRDNRVVSVRMVDEGSKYVNATQAMSAILIQKDKKTDKIKLYKNPTRDEGFALVDIRDIMNSNTGNAIFSASQKEYQVMRELRKFPTIGELSFIANLKGELDVAVNKKSISSKDTGYPLIRGRDIGYYTLNASRGEFTDEEFVYSTKKRFYVESERIACQQIVNMSKERRVTFALIPENCVLANTCNFIYVGHNSYGIDTYVLLGLLNSSIIDWLFRLTSNTNHVCNYEVDRFPIPINSDKLGEISSKVRDYLGTRDSRILGDIERLSLMAYGLM